MKKILIVITKDEIGGAQVSVYNLAKSLKERGMGVMVAFGQSYESYEVEPRKIGFLRGELGNAKIPYHQFRWLGRTRNPLTNILFVFEIKKFLNKNHFDVVHFNSSNALIGALGAKFSKSKPKTVFTFHGLSLLDPNHKASPISKSIYRLIFKFFLDFIDKKVFVSRENLEYARKINLVKEGRVIYNGINPEELKFLGRNEARKFLANKTGINLENKFLIGSIGRLAYPKNYEFLIEVFPEILKINKSAVGLIIGDGPERNNLQLITNNLQLQNKIFFVGELKDAYQYLRAFDLFVLPSKYEGLSITLIEALFAGLPILATKVGGNPEVLEKAGWLYDLDNKKDFLEKAEKMIQNEKIRNELPEKAKTRASQFALDKTIEGYLNVYKTTND